MSITIKGEKRENFGKNVSRRIRKEGNLPAILYGMGKINVPLTLTKKEVFSILKSESGENTIFQVSVNSEKMDVMIKEHQIDPVSNEVLHIDLIQIALDKEIKLTVPVHMTGEAIGVKAEGGFVDIITRDVEIECFPKDIPDFIEIDISDLHLHQSIKIEEVVPPEGVKLVSDPQAVVALIQAPAKEEVVVEEEEEEEIITEEAEPELIKKEKTSEEEEKEK